MKRSNFIQIIGLGTLAAACGASGKKHSQEDSGHPDKAASGASYDWKPGQPIHIHPVHKTQKEWKKLMTADRYHIMREAGTERAFHNKYWNNHKEGIYFCAACALPLFSSKAKFRSGTGWPSFYEPIDRKVVASRTDHRLGMIRTEIHCA